MQVQRTGSAGWMRSHTFLRESMLSSAKSVDYADVSHEIR
jgi:hypothetical protein